MFTIRTIVKLVHSLYYKSKSLLEVSLARTVTCLSFLSQVPVRAMVVNGLETNLDF